jgi:hypothetical protein
MAEWDRLVERCSNNLPVTMSEKLIDGTFELCFCCVDSPSMEVINLPCCKTSVHRHCVLEALQSNNQCVYCRKVLDPQDIIDCTPQPKALSGEANCFPNYFTYRIKGTTRGKHVRRGERFTNNYTSRIKGTTRGKHVPERNICQHESTKHSW